MRNKLFLFLINCLLLFVSTCVEGQSKIDSLFLKQLSFDLNDIYTFRGDYKYKNYTLQNINRSFCSLNVYKSEKADSLLRFYLDGSESLKPYGQSCFVRNYYCFTPAQRELLKVVLPTYLKVDDRQFHKLVSLYDLRNYTDYLLENVKVEDLLETLKQDIKDGGISQSLINEIKNMAVLANFGYTKYEDEIIRTINAFYPYAVQSGQRVQHIRAFYFDLLPNSLALLNSKKSVMETIFLLDETRFNNDGGNDTTPEDFSKMYYGSIIEPKIKSFGVRNMMDMYFDKERFKKILEEDDTIWWDYIRR